MKAKHREKRCIANFVTHSIDSHFPVGETAATFPSNTTFVVDDSRVSSHFCTSKCFSATSILNGDESSRFVALLLL